MSRKPGTAPALLAGAAQLRARGGTFTMSTETMSHTQPAAGDERGVKILAKSVYKQLKQSGASRAEIVGFTNAMLELVTTEIRDGAAPDA